MVDGRSGAARGDSDFGTRSTVQKRTAEAAEHLAQLFGGFVNLAVLVLRKKGLTQGDGGLRYHLEQ
jgi:hypothetical protein